MYLHIGQNEILPDRRVIGIFDLDKCSYGKRTREYLAAAEKEGVVLDVSGEERSAMTVEDLLRKFREGTGRELDNDRMLLSD